MRFFDRLKLAFHNMWVAKSRTLLTILVAFVVSLLIQVIGIACINMASNISRFAFEEYKSSGGGYYLQGGYNPNIDKEAYNKAYDTLKDVPTITTIYDQYSNLNLSSYDLNGNITLHDYRSGAPSDIAILEGRTWNSSDSNTNNIVISSDIAKKISAYGTSCNVGDTVPFDFYYSSSNYSDSATITFNIVGIYNLTSNSDSSYIYSNMICDINYIMGNTNYTPSNIKFAEPYQEGSTFLPLMIESIQSDKAIKAAMEDTFGKDSYRTGNIFMDAMSMILIIDAVIVGLGIILGFIVLLLSIGSVANTMMISIDKNRRFTGLMMSMGLKPKNIRSVIRWEGAITILIGIFLSTLLCIALIPVFTSVLSGIFNTMFGAVGFEAAFSFSMPYYYSLGVAAVFILMAVAFTRAGISGLVKQDPITIISEVG